MPLYSFNKLIRDKLRAEYERLNQKATYRTLPRDEFTKALKQNLIEEVNEIDTDDKKSVLNELADVHQVIDDIMSQYKITLEEVTRVKLAKFEKKGGFSKATFVKTLELSDDDKWNEYYRNEPEKYIEVESE